MMLAEVDELERVGTARETGRHWVVVVLEAHAPARAASATDLVVMLCHGADGIGGMRRLGE